MTMTRTGYVRDTPDSRDAQYDKSAPKGRDALPERVDLRPRLPACWKQTVGSCVPHAVAGMVSLLDQSRHREPSRMFLYFNARILSFTTRVDTGCMPRDCLRAAGIYGECEELLWPEDPSAVFKQPTKAAYGAALSWKASEYYSMNFGLVAMRRCLADGFAFVFGMSLYDSYLTAATTGQVTMPKTKGDTYRDEHGVCAVGYDHSERKFLIRNSKGPDWGEGGYFWLPYSYMCPRLVMDVWTLRKMS